MSASAPAGADPAPPSRWNVLRVPDFRLLWLGETLSVLGSQFHLIALQWLVLQMAESGRLLGLVLMVAAVPRAILMLAGGVASDRHAPRTILIASNLARAAIVAALALYAGSQQGSLPLLFLLVFLFGVADAFFYPAYMAIVPRLVSPAQLPAANSMLQGSGQLMGLAGPTSAGFVIAAAGIAAAFWLDSVSFAVAALLALAIRPQRLAGETGRPATSNMFAAIGEGLRHAWSDRLMRALLLITAAANIAFIGPFVVGTALLADQLFGSAQSLGVMIGASAAGMLAGTIAAGIWQPARRRGLMIIALPLIAGVGIVLLAYVSQVEQAVAIRAAIGVAVGYMNVFTLTLLQRRIEPSMMGRIMSFIMFMSFGLHPISYMIAGFMAPLGFVSLFEAGGTLLVGAAVVGAMSKELRRFD